MNAIYRIIPEDIVNALGWTFFHSLWQFALIALVLGIILTVLGKFSSQFRYFLVSSGHVFLLVVAVFTFLSNYNNATDDNIIKEEARLAPSTIAIPNEPGDVAAADFQETNTSSFFVQWIDHIKLFFNQHFPILVMIWLLGIFVLSLRFLGNLAYVHRLKNYRTIPLDNEWQMLLCNMKDKLAIEKEVALVKSLLVKSPLVVGYLKPAILLPFSIMSGISTREIESIIAHELAHIKRHDYVINLLQKLIEILFFYHPAVWWISSVIKAERENCCDDIAISVTGDSVTLVKALAAMEERKQAELAVAFSGNKNKLLKRIQRLLNQRKMKANFMEGFIASCVIFAGLIAMAFTFSTEPKTFIDPAANSHAVDDTNSYNVLKNLEAGERVKTDEKTKVIAETEQATEEVEIEVVRKHELDEAYEEDLERLEEQREREEEIREAMEAARDALEEAEIELMVEEAMKAVELERTIHEAMEAASESLRGIDLNALINEAVHAAREASRDVDVDEIMEEISEEIEEAMEDLEETRIEIKNLNKHKEIIQQGVAQWNKWRNENPDIQPQLVGVDLSEANLENANLSNVNLIGADLKETNLKNADLTGANLQGANMKEASPEGTVLQATDLTGANLKEVNLSGKDLRGVRLIGTNLKEASLKKTDLRNADLRGTNIKEADLTGADLRDADLRGADLSEAVTRNTNFNDALANRNTLFPPGFDSGKEGVKYE